MIATRYVAAAAGLLALALVPTVVHNYLGLASDDGRRTAAIPSELAGAREVPLDRPSTWTKAQFKSSDAFERRYVDDAGRSARLAVITSYDAKTLYHHPEHAIAYGMGYDSADVMVLAGLPDVPVHVLRREQPDQALALYAICYDGRFVGNPYAFQVSLVWKRLFTPRKPATLLFARGEGPGVDRIESSLPAKLLVAAVNAFVAQARGASSKVEPTPR